MNRLFIEKAKIFKNDPRDISREGREPMVVCQVTVLAPKGPVDAGREDTIFLNVIAYGALGEILLRGKAGDRVSAFGRLTNRLNTKQGKTYRNLTLVCDAVAIVNEDGKAPTAEAGTGTDTPSPKAGQEGFDDDIPF